MAPSQPLAKYQYVVTPAGPKILPIDEPSCKDEESPADYNTGGYLPVSLNDTFKGGRYKVVRKLGWGHFSTVWLVKDVEEQRHSALKVVKSAGRYAETARDEIKLLSRVAAASPDHLGRQHIVSFLDSFCHQGPEASHICIVFEPLGENLLALIERNRKRGVPRAVVKIVAKQALLALQYLHDECDLVHTDIKPENILISIPDIESHISTELSLSPLPTSRRVGVPLPSNIRSSMGRQRSTRKSVQIFDSQPLSSPCRSAGPLSLGMSFGAPFGTMLSGNASGCTSIAGSAAGSPSLPTPFIERKPLPPATAPKVPSGLSATAPRKDVQKPSGPPKPTPLVKVSPILSSPSTSSSSSSIASTAACTDTATSSISTPPTSLPNSFGSASLGMLMMKSRMNADVSTLEEVDHEDVDSAPSSSVEGAFSSWKERFGSWKDKISGSSSSKSSNVPELFCTDVRSSQSPSLSSSWKDPGVSAPAPAVVVSTSVRADGLEERCDHFGAPSPVRCPTSSSSATKSGSSSNTVTAAHPSPSGTLHASPASPAPGLSQDAPAQAAHPPPGFDSTARGTGIFVSRCVHKSTGPSLLSQTAPHRAPALEAKSSQSKSKATLPPISTTRVEAESVKSPSTPPPTPCSPATSRTAHASSPPLAPMSAVTRSAGKPQPVAIPPPPVSTAPILPSATIVDLPPPLSIKIADMGNATPSKKHYTEDIQTRQYRAPEAIIGRKDWDTTADIWSVACVLFELLTAEYLFDPQGQGELFSKDDDHMAQIIELMGDFDLDLKMGGRFSKELFDHNGNLRYIRNLKPWPLKRVMMEKYLYTDAEAKSLCSFLEPMLAPDFRKRACAGDMIDHPWLEVVEGDEVAGSW